jgi:phosphoglycolate phosphatase
MRPQAILFDLDGTLADTLAGIAWSMNHALEQLGLPTHPADRYRRFVGNGIEKLVERALPDDWADRVDEITAMYRPILEAEGTPRTNVFDGVPEMLEQLAARGLRLAVLSNKPHKATCDVVAHLFADHDFAVVRGHVDGTPVKPNPASARQVLAELGIQASGAWYVGDSDVDMQLAHNAGLRAIGVTWGMRDRAELQAHGADAIIDHPAELLALAGL